MTWARMTVRQAGSSKGSVVAAARAWARALGWSPTAMARRPRRGGGRAKSSARPRAGGLGPVGVGLVGQERAPAEEGQGTLGGGQGEGRLAGQAGLGLGVSRSASSR